MLTVRNYQNLLFGIQNTLQNSRPTKQICCFTFRTRNPRKRQGTLPSDIVCTLVDPPFLQSWLWSWRWPSSEPWTLPTPSSSAPPSPTPCDVWPRRATQQRTPSGIVSTAKKTNYNRKEKKGHSNNSSIPRSDFMTIVHRKKQGSKIRTQCPVLEWWKVSSYVPT